MKTNNLKNRAIFTAIMMTAFTMTVTPYAKGANQRSSTFVGNGGSTQDLDLAAALSVIHEMGSKMKSDISQTLCHCPDTWSENDICRVLRQLSDKEIKFCRDMLTRNASELARLSSRDSGVRFIWSNNKVTAKSPGGVKRIADAVTQPEKKTIILDHHQFRKMPATYRVALLTHELFHLIKIDSQYLSDESDSPPFSSGRAMLDTLGAAVAVEANEQQLFNEWIELSDISRSWKHHWVAFEIQAIDSPAHTTSRLLKSKDSGGSSLKYSWRPADVSLDLGLDYFSYSGTYKSHIIVYESLSLYTAGTSLKFSPINAYLSRWNESFVTFGAYIVTGIANYRVSDQSITLKDSSSVKGFGGGTRFFMPLKHSFWVNIGYDMRHVRYEYGKFKIKTIENQNIYTLGGAYGF